MEELQEKFFEADSQQKSAIYKMKVLIQDTIDELTEYIELRPDSESGSDSENDSEVPPSNPPPTAAEAPPVADPEPEQEPVTQMSF